MRFSAFWETKLKGESMAKTRYGIFGGTFDPFTEAHLEIVRQALI